VKQTLFFLFLVSIFSFGQTIPSGFQLVAYEGFDYSNGTDISNQGGGSGWSSNWVANYYGNSSMFVYSAGYSYSGLTTNGNRLEWGGYGQYQPHAVKRSVSSPNSGIVYFQFISDFRSTSGGGTDNIRFYKGGALKGGVGGNGSPHTINILDSGLSNGISSGSAIGDQSLVVMRINYDSNTTEVWVNPNLSTFDYINPGSADAQASYDIEFDQIELVFRSGAAIDEITIFKLIPLPEIDISLTANTITETASIGSLVGAFSATDSDTSDNNLIFSFASGNGVNDADNVSFTISGTSLLTSSTLDYETKMSYNIYINVNDGANNYAKAFTVSVTNINEAPVDLGFVDQSLNSNGLILYLDSRNTNSYSGSGNIWYDLSGNGNHFTIQGQMAHDFTDGFTFQSGQSSNYPHNNNFPHPTSEYTDEFYLKTPLGNSCGIKSYAISGNDNASTIFDTNSVRIYYFHDYIDTNVNISDNQYHHFVRTSNRQTGEEKIYIDGNLVWNANHRIGYILTSGGSYFIGQEQDAVGGSLDSSQTFSGFIPIVRTYNRVLSSEEVTDNYNAIISNGNPTGVNSSGASSSTASLDEGSAVGTLVGTLTATDSDTTDFTFSLVPGNGTNDQHNSSFTISGTQLLVAGNIDYETNSSLNIYVQASDGSNTFAKALTVNVNDINEPPVITATTLSNDNGSINVTFSEPVFISADASNTLPLEVSDFALSISGGTATLSSTTPSSISVNGNIYTLGLTLSGIPDGNETLTVVPIQDAIYDAGAATASTTQSNNMVSLHGDGDSDGVNDALDQCPNTPGGASVDVNGCADSQKDPDNDGISGMNDNCPNTANSNQTDTDGDGLGDACDPDIDNDGIANSSDNCPYDYNPDQKDTDTDGMGDLCDRDNDNDGYDDGADRFPFDPTEWFDSDNDGIGNNADTDDDNDTYLDTDDAFPLDRKEWLDSDGDGIGNNKDTDDDNDGVEDREDDLPLDPNEYLDTDKDGIGNNLDDDDDDDGYSDLDEIACNTDPLKRSSRPEDYDRDLSPDCIDTDDDNDGCLDQEDLFPFNERECIDTDGDGIGDNADMDADNDGIIDSLDDFPTDPNESKDTDGDGIGDNADLDDNNDGFPEDPITNSAGEEVIPIFVSELLTPNQSGEESTWRIVNIDKYPSANVKIYSPTGEIVYESWDYNNDWNGTNKDGKTLPTGPYFYRIDRGNETTVEEGWLYIFN
jgi:gliding motility-associated-like protein